MKRRKLCGVPDSMPVFEPLGVRLLLSGDAPVLATPMLEPGEWEQVLPWIEVEGAHQGQVSHPDILTAASPVGLDNDALIRTVGTQAYEANQPIGEAKGIYPGRVVWVHDPSATGWDGSTGYWWEEGNTDQSVVDDMMSRSIRWLTGQGTDSAAWDALFRHFNQTRSGLDVAYQAGERIAVKVNLNNSSSHSDQDNQVDTSPQMILALLRQLIYSAGVSPSAITVYDASRWIPDRVYDPVNAEFPAVSFVDVFGGHGRIRVTADETAVVRYSGLPEELSSFLPTALTEAKYLINLAALKRHGGAGITLCGKNHFGSVADLDGRWSPEELHPYTYVYQRTVGSYHPVVDLMGHEETGGKTLLYMIDGLYGTDLQNKTPTRWETLEGDWSSSILVSQDPVAIDSVGLDFLRSEFWNVHESSDDYLHQAATAEHVRAWGFYDPEGDGTGLESLGVHEHWNNSIDRQYTRNLGTGDGIALISSEPDPNRPPTVEITQPVEGGIYALGAELTMVADAEDTDGMVVSVEFFADGRSLGVDDDGSDGWSLIWAGETAGEHVLTATATDDLGLPGGSAPVNVTIAMLGDADTDGDVDRDDFRTLVRNFPRAGLTWREGDFNGNGVIDSRDYVVLKANLGRSVVETVGKSTENEPHPPTAEDQPAPGSTTAEPEPIEYGQDASGTQGRPAPAPISPTSEPGKRGIDTLAFPLAVSESVITAAEWQVVCADGAETCEISVPTSDALLQWSTCCPFSAEPDVASGEAPVTGPVDEGVLSIMSLGASATGETTLWDLWRFPLGSAVPWPLA